ncbi:IclR family transcriptional regulator [Novosphingobium rosa]|uniref:IclR family transcriptional regulator n=1 Tax=Novosphingobium rosa TaxID=76978 RepID=UPI00082BDAAE|nr:IclR family transcriptional regulator [Novosphingobium rosa]
MSAPALHRAVAILRLFRRDRAQMSAPEVVAASGLPRSTVHSLLGDLVALGLLRRDGAGRFELDAGVLTLGYEYLASSGLTNLAAPVLEALRNETNWSTHLGVRQGRSIVYLSRFASRAAVTRNVAVGTSLPAHSTVMGRVLLSDLEPLALRDLYADHAFGPNGIASLADLEQMLREDHARGHVASTGFHEAGVAVVAAPVRDASLQIVAAINATATGPASTDLSAITQAVARAAHAISRLMGAPETLPLPAEPLVQAGAHHEKDA